LLRHGNLMRVPVMDAAILDPSVAAGRGMYSRGPLSSARIGNRPEGH